jgi:hypothetical protein
VNPPGINATRIVVVGLKGGHLTRDTRSLFTVRFERNDSQAKIPTDPPYAAG